MTSKTVPLIIVVTLALIGVLPSLGLVIPPSAIAQEDDDEENLASGTVSNVLESGSTSGDNANTQVSVPLIDQDQTDANLGVSEALDVTVERTLSPQEEEEPPEFVAFCLQEEVNSFILCFDTSEECAEAQEFLEDQGFVISMECEGVETFPPGALECVVSRDNQGEIVSINCQ